MKNHNCGSSSHISRRTLLQTAGALSMTPLAMQLTRAAEETGRSGRPKSLIILWLKGAPSQYETFDPHAGTKYGGDAKAIGTSVKGLEISDFLPQTAEQMHNAALIRSVTSKEGDHQRAFYNIQTGWRPDPTLKHPAIGAVVCHAPTDYIDDPEKFALMNRGADIPRHISILPSNSPGRGGYLGAKYDAFKIYNPSSKVPDVQPYVDKERFQRRVSGLTDIVEKNFARGRLRNLDTDRTLHKIATQSAMTMMDSDQLKAFELDKEPESVRKGFGETPFGQGCLAAARLIEVGVRCVEVSLSGWDTHADNHNGQKTQCDILDPAYASLLKILEERDLLKDTLVVCGGEFGRTPSINPLGGRDHWPHGFSMVLAGTGIRKGVVYGETSATPNLEAKEKTSHVKDAVTVEDVHATVMKALDIDYARDLDTPIGRPLKRSEGTPIQGVLA